MRSGADGIRTHDPLVANQVLSQLSYRPEAAKITGSGSPAFRSTKAYRLVALGNQLLEVLEPLARIVDLLRQR
jgi:hypothetical protein